MTKGIPYLASVFFNFEGTASPACSHTIARPLPSLVSWVSRWQHIMWIFHVMLTWILRTSYKNTFIWKHLKTYLTILLKMFHWFCEVFDPVLVVLGQFPPKAASLDGLKVFQTWDSGQCSGRDYPLEVLQLFQEPIKPYQSLITKYSLIGVCTI